MTNTPKDPVLLFDIMNRRLDEFGTRLDRLHARIDFLEDRMTSMEVLAKRVEQLEANQLRWFTETRPEPAPQREEGVYYGSGGGGAYKPQRDTSWHAYDPTINPPPKGDKRVAVMVRGHDEIRPVHFAHNLNWGECADSTIVAWRYAKEGE